jgi:hypothetical protein
MGEEMCDTFLPDTVLCHLDGLDSAVRCVGLGPCLHTASLEAVAPADDELEVRHLLALLTRSLLLCGKRSERVGYEDTGSGAETIVVQVQVAQWRVLGEEVDKRGYSVESEGIVRKVDGVEFGKGEESSDEVGERRWDLGQETRCEDVGEVRDLSRTSVTLVLDKGTTHGDLTYLEALLGLEYLCQSLASFHTESVTQEPDLLNLVMCLQVFNVWLNVLGRGEFEAFALDRKDFRCRHCAQRLVQQAVQRFRK